MAFYQKKWWQKLVSKKNQHEKVDAVKDIQAMREFLQDLSTDQTSIEQDLKKLQELEQERQVANSGILQINLETQAEVLEKLLDRYEFFQNDVAISGLRMKRVAQQFLQHAQEAGLKDLVKEKKKKLKWRFLW